MSAAYEEKSNELKNAWESFITDVDAGKEGHGSKSASLRARKGSMAITSLLKEYRSVSVANDKNK